MPSGWLSVPHFQQEHEYSCVAACAWMVLAHYGDMRTDAELRSRLAQSAAANGWNEPEMDDYDHYDAKRANNAREAR